MKGVYDDINGTLGYQMKIRHFVQLFIYLSGQYTGIPKNMKIFSLWFINVQKALFSAGAAFIQALHAQRNTPAASMIACGTVVLRVDTRWRHTTQDARVII